MGADHSLSGARRLVVIGLGANVGDPARTLALAAGELAARIEAPRASSLWETEPVGPPQPRFLNAAVAGRTRAEPEALLAALLEIERRFGRVRVERWGPRILDLDVLWMEGVRLATPGLEIPHPRLLERRFALVPLVEVAADARDPRTGEPLAAALARLPPAGERRLAGPEWAALPASAPGPG